jgi:hypothetical protein
MRFYFDSDQTEAGFVWLRDDPFHQFVEVTAGLGSERNTGQYLLPPRDNTADPLLPNTREKMCRIAIALFLKNTEMYFHASGYIDETVRPWNGVLRPIRDFKKN